MGSVFCGGREKPEEEGGAPEILRGAAELHDDVFLADDDEKAMNLMKRFPDCSEAQVRDALARAKGHAGVAAKTLKEASDNQGGPASSRTEPDDNDALQAGEGEDNGTTSSALTEAEEVDKVINLMKRFPELDEAAVRNALKRSRGNAGLASQQLKRIRAGESGPTSTEPTSAPSSPGTAATEPAAPASPRDPAVDPEEEQVTNLMARFPDSGEKSVRLALKRSNGHAGRAVTILKNQESGNVSARDSVTGPRRGSADSVI